MSSWSKAGKEVRLILFECLNRPEAKNIYFNPVQCAELCNLAAGLDFCRGIDSLRIGRAFFNGGESDYSLQFNQLIIGSDATHFLHVLIDKRMDGERYTAVGCFTSEVERIKALQRNISHWLCSLIIVKTYSHINHLCSIRGYWRFCFRGQIC